MNNRRFLEDLTQLLCEAECTRRGATFVGVERSIAVPGLPTRHRAIGECGAHIVEYPLRPKAERLIRQAIAKLAQSRCP